MIDMGCSLVFYGCDIIFVKTGLEATREAMLKQGLELNGSLNGRLGKSYLEGAK